jgi:hypothetical protein
MKASRTIQIAAIAIVMLISFSGCEGKMFLGPLAIKRDGGRLLVAVCSSVTAVEITGDERHAGMFEHWQSFWTATGHISVVRGDIFATATPIAGLNATLAKSPRMGPGDAIDIAVRPSSEADSRYLHAVFQLNSSKLSESVWLHPDGKTTESPCASS